jgi:ATP-dependent DNA helicase RecG
MKPYPGSDRSVALVDLQKEQIISRRHRNRHIGDFLKQLELTEGRSTGIPKMREAMSHNGSPMPRLLTDEERTYFRIELPIHPAFAQAHDEAHDGPPSDLDTTEKRVVRSLRSGPRSVPDIAQELGYASRSGHLKKALDRLDQLGLIALTIPTKPRSKNQKRRLTERGKAALASLEAQGKAP